MFNIKRTFNFVPQMEKKEQILVTALQMFGDRGYEGTSIRDLSAEAGINIAMINYYFGSKEKLFEEVIAYKTSYLKNIFLDIANDRSLSPIEKVYKVINHLVERILSSPVFHQLVHRELSLNQRTGTHKGLIDLLLGNSFIIRDIINQGIKEDVFEKVDVELTVSTLFGTISQLTISEELCRKLLRKNEEFEPYNDKRFRKRVVDHLVKLMSSLLLKREKN